MLQRVKKGVFREPPDGSNRLAWFIIACVVIPVGCAAIIAGLFFSDYSMIGSPSYNLPQVLFALGMISQITAELVRRTGRCSPDRCGSRLWCW